MCLLFCSYAYAVVWCALRYPIDVSSDFEDEEDSNQERRERRLLIELSQKRLANQVLKNSLRYIFVYFITWG